MALHCTATAKTILNQAVPLPTRMKLFEFCFSLKDNPGGVGGGGVACIMLSLVHVSTYSSVRRSLSVARKISTQLVSD